ncbi:hypothetical protein HYV80_04295 [Candidatus Woesearchaeota archaeon]|nr:hypothetical protein [Candidatus Woesearchaeota archaeon]
MARHVCISCGNYIVMAAFNDPYLCRECERILEEVNAEGRYGHLENMH